MKTVKHTAHLMHLQVLMLFFIFTIQLSKLLKITTNFTIYEPWKYPFFSARPNTKNNMK